MTAVVVAVRPGQSPRVAEPEAAPRHRRVVTWYALVASLTFFAALQHVLLAASYRADVARVGTGLAMASTPRWLASMGRFLALALAAMVAVGAGRRWLAMAAVSVAVFLPVVVPSTAFMLTGTRMPQPIGAGWYLQTSAVRQPPAALLWFGAFVDIALVLAPAAAGAWTSSETRPRRRPTPLDVAAFSLCLTGLGLYSYQRVLMHGLDGTSPWADLLSLLPLFAVGAVCSGERMSRLVLVIGLAVVSTYEVTLSLVQVSGPSLTSTLTSRQTWSPLVPAVIAAGLGAMWVPVARLAGRARDSNTFLLISVNVLNVADAILTWAAVHSGDAIETNPIIGLIGLPAKILLVAGASIWVSRTRPRVLVVPLFVLAAVFAYHLIGLRLNN